MRRALGTVVAAALLTGCGNAAPAAREPLDRPARFGQELTYVEQQGGTAVLHHGDRELEVPGRVETLWPTPYGFLVEHRTRAGEDAPREVVFTDGRTTQRVEGRPQGITISPDGRYAGWIDRDGPDTSTGQKALVVVVDLHTGEEVLRDGSRMGGRDDDIADLYEELSPAFRGFAGSGGQVRAYWQVPEGDDQGRLLRRAVLPDGEPQNGGEMSSDQVERPLEPLSDRLVGRSTGMDEDGRASASGDGLGGFVSPDGRWCLSNGEPGRLPVVGCRDARKATPAYPAKAVTFAGWAAADAFYVMGQAALPESWDPEDPPRTPGVLARCTLPSGRCPVVREVPAVEELVLGTGTAALY